MRSLRLSGALAALLVALLALPITAQDDAPTTADSAQETQELDLRTVPTQINRLVAQQKTDEAAKLLTDALEGVDDEPTLIRLQSTRMILARGYMRSRNNQKAMDQFKKVIEFNRERLDNMACRNYLVGATTSLNSMMQRTGQGEAAFEMVADIYQQIKKAEQADESVPGVSFTATLLSSWGASPALSENQRNTVLKELAEQIQMAEAKQAEKPQDAQLISTLSSLYRAGMLLNRSNPAASKSFSDKQYQLVVEAVKANPDNTQLAAELVQVAMFQVSSSYRDDPEAAQKMIDDTLQMVDAVKDEPALSRMLPSLMRYEGRIASAIKVKKLIGQPAPEFQIDGWANNEANVSLESLKGKVVLIDFWAVWCGPCVATFPHLRELREEFGDQGFEIVGVTRYYNYQWDEDQEKAVRGGDPVEPEIEHDAVARFMASHELGHPTIFTPKDSTMQADYGVTGIPHAVVVDRSGRIRLIKVGSGEANAQAIHEMIKELIAEKP